MCRGLGLKLWLARLSLAYYDEIGQLVMVAHSIDRESGELISFIQWLSKLGSISGLVAPSDVSYLLWMERLADIVSLWGLSRIGRVTCA